MSPKVIIFLLRNQIFSLEIEKLRLEKDKKDRNKNYLSKYNRIKLEIDQLIIEKRNIKYNNDIIIDTLHSRVKILELEILNLEKLLDDKRKEKDEHSQEIVTKDHNQENKEKNKNLG